MAIPIIDLFAGPGGLGEGFSSLIDKKGERIFDIRLSIEKDENAHKTLELRSFFRKFPLGDVPDEYYDILKQRNLAKREDLKQNLYREYPVEAQAARNEAWQVTLGEVNPDLVDTRIKEVLKDDKDWVLIGGPPCQAYSLVGRSRRQWKDNMDTTDIRVHLYKEYLRIIAAHHPAVFVMENVKGLLSAKVDGEKMFNLIRRDLQDPSTVFPGKTAYKYKVYSLVAKPLVMKDGQPIYKKDSDFLIHSERYGVPQRRHRVILLGVREDIDIEPAVLTPCDQKRSVADVIGDLPAIRSGINRSFIDSETIKGKKKRIYQDEVDSDERWKELVNLFKTEIVSWNGLAKSNLTKEIQFPANGTGSEFVQCKSPDPENPLYSWYRDPKLKGVANHESRSHLVQDMKRYLFSSLFAETYKRSPLLHEYEKHSVELLPDHKNASSGKFADRFKVQLRNEPSATITSHISKDGHYFIHYDPTQCRSLTVREAARIQTFPDNYLFCGARTAQFHQVGNAVPPYLAFQIAQVVMQIFGKLHSSNKN